MSPLSLFFGVLGRIQMATLGKFTVIEELGKGSFGRVYRVKNEWDQVRVLKVLDKGNSLKEASIQAKLEHPHIVEVHSYDSTIKPAGAIEMEFLPGGSLADVL